MDTRSSPQGILLAHLVNKIAKLGIDLWPTAQIPGLPAPPSPKAHPMPTHDGFRMDNHQRFSEFRPQPQQPNQHRAVETIEANPLGLPSIKHTQLVAEKKHFRFQACT